MRKREAALHALLAVLDRAPGPMGTRAARQSLEELGLGMSESTVSRRLKELDERGWTVPVAAKGRVLSDRGRRVLDEREHERAHGHGREHETAGVRPGGQRIDVRDIRDVIDLLHARKAVESASAADAATHASPKDLQELERLVHEHREAIGTEGMLRLPGLAIHRKIAALSPNPMLKTLTELILSPRLDEVEAALDILLGSDDQLRSAADDHRRILDTLRAGDAAAAEQAMNDHFDRMIEACERLVARGDSVVVERLLALVGSEDSPLLGTPSRR